MSGLRIDYIGATWCKVCVDVKPAIEKLSKDFTVACNFLDLDTMENNEHITKVPTVIVYDGDKVIHTIITKHVDSLKTVLTERKGVVISDYF
jgi:thiol-disulfide isomerase/thioredoxin